MKSITRKRINAKKGAVSGGGGGTGTVTNISTTSPILGGPISVAGTISFDEGANFTWTGSHNFTVDLPQSAIVPTGPDDFTNKAYVDALVAGLSPQGSVLVATAAALPACTAAGAGVGKTLTMNAVGILTVDTVALVLGDNILVKNQVAAKDNGVYTVTTEGTAGVAAVLTRRTNYDQTAEVVLGTFFGVSGGSQTGTVWIMISPNPVVVDTDPINFTFFFLGTSYTASQGVQLSGTNFSANLDPAGAIILNGNQLTNSVDGTTIDIVANNLTFIGSASDVINDSTIAGASVADALDTLGALVSPTLTDVLTNGNTTSLTTVFDDGGGNTNTIDPIRSVLTDGASILTITPRNITLDSGGLNSTTITDTITTLRSGTNALGITADGLESAANIKLRPATGLNIADPGESVLMFGTDVTTGDWYIGDGAGALGTPFIQASAGFQNINFITSGGGFTIDGPTNAINADIPIHARTTDDKQTILNVDGSITYKSQTIDSAAVIWNGVSTTYVKKFHLTSADIQSGNTTPIVLVAAAGAGTAICARHDTTARCINGVVPMVATSMAIRCGGKQLFWGSGFLASTTSNPIMGDDSLGVDSDIAISENTDLTVEFDVDNPAYDGTIDIYLEYSIITL